MRMMLWPSLVLLLAALPARAQPAPEPSGPSAAPEPTPSAEPPSEPATPQAIVPDEGADLDEGSVVQSITQRVGMNVFGDASFIVESEDSPHSTFELGAIGMILNAEFTPTLSAISEVAFEFAAGDDGLAAPVADVERLQLQYIGDRVTVAAGRLHTECGYWNTAYHHGRWLQLPVERPHAVQFEDDGGMLPIHTVGLQGSYRVDAGAGSVRLTGAIGNGRGRIEDDVLTVADTNEMKSALLKIESVDLGHRDLRVGVSAMIDRIAPWSGRAQVAASTINEVIGNAFVAYRGEALTAIAEVYVVDHAAAGDHWLTTDAFGLLGWDTGRLVPFVSFEVRRAPAEVDPFYSPDFDPGAPAADARSSLADDLLMVEAGSRIDLSEWSVVKLEVEIERTGGETSVAGVANWSFGI